MPKHPQRSITVTPEMFEAVEAYRLEHNLRSWSQALLVLAALALKWEKPIPEWGGARQKNDWQEFLDEVNPTPEQLQVFLESIEG